MTLRCVMLWALWIAPANAQEWAGVSPELWSSIGAAHVTKHVERDLWRAALASGALVRVEVLATEDDAQRAFAFQSRALTSRVPEEGVFQAGDAVGNGEDYLLVRDQNVLLSVHDAKGHQAAAHVERLREALVMRSAAPDDLAVAPSG